MKKNKESNSIIAFMDNGSIQILSDNNPINYDGIAHLFIPIQGFNSESYLYVKSTSKNRFTKAYLRYKLSLTYWNDGSLEYSFPFSEGELETSSLITFYNLLHSFERYFQIYGFENTFIDNRLPSDVYVDIDYFEIRLENNDDLIYSNFIPNHLSSAEKNEILESIMSKVFKLDKDLFKYIHNDTIFRIKNNEWEIVKFRNLSKEDLIGIVSVFTSTVIFISYSDYLCIGRTIKGVSINFNIIDVYQYPYIHRLESNELHDRMCRDIFPIKSVLYWISDVISAIAFIDLLGMYSTIIKAMCSLFFQYFYPSDDHILKMKLEGYEILCIDFYSISHPSEIIVFNDATRINLSDFVNSIRLIDGKDLL